jgi:hypothetical protein
VIAQHPACCTCESPTVALLAAPVKWHRLCYQESVLPGTVCLPLVSGSGAGDTVGLDKFQRTLQRRFAKCLRPFGSCSIGSRFRPSFSSPLGTMQVVTTVTCRSRSRELVHGYEWVLAKLHTRAQECDEASESTSGWRRRYCLAKLYLPFWQRG